MKESNYRKLTAKEAEKEVTFYSNHGYASRLITEDDFRTIGKERTIRWRFFQGRRVRMFAVRFEYGVYLKNTGIQVGFFGQKRAFRVGNLYASGR